MSNNSVADKEIILLKKKLDLAISSRADLETDLKSQSSLLIKFIEKLSLVCKGMDITLDNKLANLRALLKKSAPLADIQIQIESTALLLQKQSLKNELNINKLHDRFHIAGLALQKTNGLPADLRRKLRALITESKDPQDAIVQYVPLLSTLLEFYDSALSVKAKEAMPAGGLLNSLPQSTEQYKVQSADSEYIERFEAILTSIVVSDKHRKDISIIKSQLDDDMSNNTLLNSFLKVFDVIIEDLEDERNTAKVFLSTLSDTLTTVQSAVKSTVSSCNKSKSQHDLLNEQLQKQIVDMAAGLDKATSLADIKVDINEKLQLIAGTLEKKTTFEHRQQQVLESQLSAMSNKVNLLEKQSRSFEKRIKEQQARSLQDALTKLNNRAAFDEYFAREIVRFHNSKFELAIVVMDLDDFKRINDTYGHTAGDKTLQVISSTLKKHVANDAFIARYGGEEFVLVFSGISPKALEKKLNILRLQVAKLPFKFKNNKVTITLSIGASHVQQNDNVHMAFERADGALYQAKEKGKNTVVYL
ncbi:MAG: GGDEF domain-containing protein [Colwellia sp.]|nr:GGDEF domain-containing protein [Colwellia sp.]